MKKKILMKRIVCMLLLMGMMLPAVASCAKNDDSLGESSSQSLADTETQGGTVEPEDTGNETEKDPEKEPEKEPDPPVYVTKTEKYLPEEVRSYYASAMSAKTNKFSAYNAGSASYAFQDALTISNLTLKKISIPVYSTGAADSNGDFKFTLLVHNITVNGLKSAPLRKYELKINAGENSLTDNSIVMKYIDVDVSELNIVLAANETLAMYVNTDTIVPAYIMLTDPTNASIVNEVVTTMADNFPQAQNGYTGVGTQTMSLSNYTNFFDFEWEKTYTEAQLKAAEEEAKQYESLVAMLKEEYAGKKVSILGDSISTFAGLSNNTSHNSTLGNHLVHYTPTTTSPYKWEQTYWGRLIEETGMELCVSNAWGGATLYGRHEPGNSYGDWTDYKDSAPYRASKLHRDDGTKPDVIIFYMGINDLHRGDSWPHGELFKLLRQVSAEDYNTEIERWFRNVLVTTQGANFLIPGQSYTTIDQAYALALYIMKQNYPDAEIICVNLLRNTNPVCTVTQMTEYNFAIKVLADYFGAIHVDQAGKYSEVIYDELPYFGTDITCVHPNAMGHAALTRTIVKTIAEYKGKKAD